MKINQIFVSTKTTELDSLTMNLINAFKSTTLSNDNYLSRLFRQLAELSAALTTAINRTNYSTLADKDQERDDTIKDLFDLTKGLIAHPDTIVKVSAQEVYDVLDKYGKGIAHESYAVESALINSLLEDLNKPELQTKIRALTGVALLIAALKKAQLAFEETNKTYETDKAKDSNTASASALKPLIINLVNSEINVYLQAMSQANPNTYKAFSQTVAKMIDTNNTAIKKRKGKASA